MDLLANGFKLDIVDGFLAVDPLEGLTDEQVVILEQRADEIVAALEPLWPYYRKALQVALDEPEVNVKLERSLGYLWAAIGKGPDAYRKVIAVQGMVYDTLRGMRVGEVAATVRHSHPRPAGGGTNADE